MVKNHIWIGRPWEIKQQALFAYTVACNYLSTCVRKTFSTGQSKFKVLSQSNFKVYPPRWNVLAPLHKRLKGSKSISNAFGHFVFGVLKIRMDETGGGNRRGRKTIFTKEKELKLINAGQNDCMISFFKVFLKANLWRDLFLHIMS